MKCEFRHFALIRADAGGFLGSGHVMRMLALSQEMQRRDLSSLFLSSFCPESLSWRIREEKLEHRSLEGILPGSCEDAELTSITARELGCSWILLDGYHFGLDYQRFLKKEGYRLLVVDDYGNRQKFCANILLNQNLGAEEFTYEHDLKDVVSLLGLDYLLLRREFLSKPSNQEDERNCERIVITMGGADAENTTCWLLDLIEGCPQQLEIIVILGGGHPDPEAVHQLAKRSRHAISIEQDIRDMKSLFRKSGRILSAGGSTCYEWLINKMDGAVLVTADNQEALVRHFVDEGWLTYLGRMGKDSRETISAKLAAWLESPFREPAHFPVDGKGAGRVLQAMMSISTPDAYAGGDL